MMVLQVVCLPLFWWFWDHSRHQNGCSIQPDVKRQREGGRKGKKEGRRDGGKEGGREGQRDGEREGGRERRRDGGMEGGGRRGRRERDVLTSCPSRAPLSSDTRDAT